MLLLYTGAVLQLCANQGHWIGCVMWGSSAFDNSSNLSPVSLDMELELLRLLLSCVRSLGAVLILIFLRKWVATKAPDLFLGTLRRHHHNDQQFWMIQDLVLHYECRLVVCSVLFWAPASIPSHLVDLTVLAVSTCSQGVFCYPPSISSIASIARYRCVSRDDTSEKGHGDTRACDMDIERTPRNEAFAAEQVEAA
jgi:hypothetical protein